MRWRTTLAGLLTLILLAVSSVTSACALHCDIRTHPCHQPSSPSSADAQAPHCAMHTTPHAQIAPATACQSHLCDQQANLQAALHPPACDASQPFVSVTITLPIQSSNTHLEPNPASPPYLLSPITLRTTLRV
jgi:hypothetical protein